MIFLKIWIPYIRAVIGHLFFSVRLTSLSMAVSRSIHVAADGNISFFKRLVSFDCTGPSLLVCRLSPVVASGGYSGRGAQASRGAGFSSCSAWALEHTLFNSCGAQAWLLHGMRNLPGSGVTPVSPALAGSFLTTRPPEKSQNAPFFNPVATKLPCIFPPLGK